MGSGLGETTVQRRRRRRARQLRHASAGRFVLTAWLASIVRPKERT